MNCSQREDENTHLPFLKVISGWLLQPFQNFYALQRPQLHPALSKTWWKGPLPPQFPFFPVKTGPLLLCWSLLLLWRTECSHSIPKLASPLNQWFNGCLRLWQDGVSRSPSHSNSSTDSFPSRTPSPHVQLFSGFVSLPPMFSVPTPDFSPSCKSSTPLCMLSPHCWNGWSEAHQRRI